MHTMRPGPGAGEDSSFYLVLTSLHGFAELGPEGGRHHEEDGPRRGGEEARARREGGSVVVHEEPAPKRKAGRQAE